MSVSKSEREFCIRTMRDIDGHIPIRYVEPVQKILKKTNVIRKDTQIRATRLLRTYDIEIVVALKAICNTESLSSKNRPAKKLAHSDSDEILKKLKMKF